MCARSPESPPCPGLHPQQCGQQGGGGDSAPLLRSRETPLQRCDQLWGPQHEKDTDLLERAQRRPRRWSGGWSPSAMAPGWESWGCSAWGGEGSGETLEQLPAPTGAGKKLERGFVRGHVVTGQGGMALSWERGDADEL